MTILYESKIMKTITNGHSEDNSFFSDNLTSLLEWCLNYKKSVFFIIDTPNTYYDVEIKYDTDASEGHYLRGSYFCHLDVSITKGNEQIYKTLFVNDDDWTIDDAVSDFTLNYITNPITNCADTYESKIKNKENINK